MSLLKVVHYKRAKCCVCKYDCMNLSLVFGMSSLYDMMYTAGKDAYIAPGESYWQNPYRMIMSNAYYDVNASGAQNIKLFISSSSKLPRDLVRNTGYKIVRDIDKADYVVIPSVDHEESASYTENIGFLLDNDELCFITINRTDNMDRFDDDDIQSILDTIKMRANAAGLEVKEFYYSPSLAPFNIQFIKKCEEYELIFNAVAAGESVKKLFVLDSRVGLVGSNNVSIETLEVWKHMNERSILEKSVINSDWQKYPCTVAVFLAQEKRSYCIGSIGQWRWLLNQIDYFEFENSNTIRKTVTPDDWNMLQKWIMHSLGLTEKGGFIRIGNDRNDSVPYRYASLIMSRICVAPMNISNEESFKNLQARAKNA